MTDGHPPAARRLIVLRHAKSDWPAGAPDKDRPLAKRGLRDAPAAGRWLAAHVGHLDLVVVSDARRTRETWEALEGELVAGGGGASEMRPSGRVYEAAVSDLVDVLRAVPDDRRTVLLIGHNPGVQDLVVALAGPRSESGGRSGRSKVPHLGAGGAQRPRTVVRPRPQGATLDEFVVPRG